MLAYLTLAVRRGGTSVGFALLFAAALAAWLPNASAQGPWKVLFDGKDLNNFIVAGRRGAAPTAPNATSGWRLQDGVVIGGPPEPGKHFGMLETKKKYYNFELQLDFLLKEIHGVRCTQKLGPNQEEMSDPACDGNSGIFYRSGYQLNIGRREAGEYIGLVVHRVSPKAIRGDILWPSYGDRAFPNLRKHNQWNTLRIVAQGDRHQAWLNGTKIVDVIDQPTESEGGWRQPQPIAFQFPSDESRRDTSGVTVKFRNIRVRTLQ